jgi:tRNA(Ile)-lysidine synthase
VLGARLRARLDAAPTGPAAIPVALGLSGGGDSMALLVLALDWARDRGRTILPLIVDHGLQSGSADIAALAAARAAALGVGARVLSWTGDKPKTGIQAEARDARLRLLTEACREAGASALLLAHTADDQAETVWLRLAAGTSWRGLVAMRLAAPAPLWPEGRGVSVIRPLLDAGRVELRSLLREVGVDWIEDKANTDRGFARVRARQMLAALGGSAVGGGVRARLLTVAHEARALADAEDSGALALWRSAGSAGADGALRLARSALASPAAARLLQVMLAAVSGQAREPAPEQVAAALERLRRGAAATLGGAAALVRGEEVLIHRDPGAVLGRSGVAPPPPVMLQAGEAMVWDGRFLVRARAPGLKVAPLGRDLSYLMEEARIRLGQVPLPVRAGLPALREGPAIVAVPAIGFGANLADIRPLGEERLERLLFAAAA